jgi:hypothetical protein
MLKFGDVKFTAASSCARLASLPDLPAILIGCSRPSGDPDRRH